MLPLLREKLQMHYDRAKHARPAPRGSAPEPAGLRSVEPRADKDACRSSSFSSTDSPLVASLKQRSGSEAQSDIAPTKPSPKLSTTAQSEVPPPLKQELLSPRDKPPFEVSEMSSIFGGNLKLVQLALDRFDGG